MHEMKKKDRGEHRWYWVPVLLILILGMAGCNGGGSSSNDGNPSSGGDSGTEPSALSQPKGVTATAGDTSVTLTWEPVTGASYYTVYWSLNPEPDPKTELFEETNIETTSWSHNSPKRGKALYYAVTAEDGTRSSEPSEVTAAIMDPLKTPANINTTPGDGEITISWDPVPGARSYLIRWSDIKDAKTDDLLQDTIVGKTSWTHKNVIRKTPFYYDIIAMDEENESSPCTPFSESCEVGFLQSPKNLVFTMENGDVTLMWDPVPEAAAYMVSWSETRDRNRLTHETGTTGITSESYKLKGLDKNTTYYFTVMAPDGEWSSKKSAPVSAYIQDGALDSHTNDRGMTFAKLPAGKFWMGSPDSEPGRKNNEDFHEVTITKDFYMMTTEVTQKQWEEVMGSNPSMYQPDPDFVPLFPGMSDFEDCPDCPVESVSPEDVREFIARLNSMGDTLTYRLPTEAEWEYAARAGTSTPFAIGNGYELTKDLANFGTEYSQTTEVGSLNAPNAWGLHDMHGNVWEWVADIWQEHLGTDPTTDPKQAPPAETDSKAYSIRGGSRSYSQSLLRSASRNESFGKNGLTGIRLAADITN